MPILKVDINLIHPPENKDIPCNVTHFPIDHQAQSATVSLTISIIGVVVSIYYFIVLVIYALRFGEFRLGFFG